VAPRRRRPLVAEARPALEGLKLSTVSHVGVAQRPFTTQVAASPQAYRQALNYFKWQIAEELGLDGKIRSLGWPQMPTRDCGAIGGRLGGQIGGQMVRRMIAVAEETLSRGPGPSPGLPARGGVASVPPGSGRF